MLHNPLNKAHVQDRQARQCIKKGLFDSAVQLEKDIIANLKEAVNASNNRLAIQSILLQKARHIATLERLEKEIEVRDRARRWITTELTSEMSDIPQFGGKTTPVLSASSCLPSNASDKDRLILRLQDKVAILSSQLEQYRLENSSLREQILELERIQSVTQLLSPQVSTYHHITPSNSTESGVCQPVCPQEETFTLTPLEQPPFLDYKW